MTEFLIAPQSLPAAGKQYILDAQAIWLEPIREFGLDCRIVSPVSADLTLFPQEDGVLIRGRLKAELILPCTRCAEDAAVCIDQIIESFEPYPEEDERRNQRGRREQAPARPAHEEAGDVDESIMRISSLTGNLEMDLAALAWQEFSLTLPQKPLCNANCKGLCPVCGVNKNLEACACQENAGDPRLAALKNFKASRK